MLKSLLVPLDGSNMSERSLSVARGVARSTGARLHLAHVHLPYEPDQLLSNSSFQWEGVDLHDYDERRFAEEQSYLEGLRERLSADGTQVDTAVIDGAPIPDELARYAETVDSDLVVMTSAGRSKWQRALGGSVVDEIVRKTSRPVLVLHPDDEQRASKEGLVIDHIVIALDGSSLAEGALIPATELARATGARITLLHIVPESLLMSGRLVTFRPDRLEPELSGAIEYLERIADELRAGGHETAVHAVRGEVPAKAIARVAGELGADVIAIATHGFGGIKRVVFGSVTTRLLETTPVSLLVVRPPHVA